MRSLGKGICTGSTSLLLQHQISRSVMVLVRPTMGWLAQYISDASIDNMMYDAMDEPSTPGADKCFAAAATKSLRACESTYK